MKNMGHFQIQTINQNDSGEAVAPAQDNRAEILHHLFPHISLLEKFVLSTVLEHEDFEKWGRKDCPNQDNLEHLSLNPVRQEIRQYAEYLCQKDKLEKRKLDGNLDRKMRPVRGLNPE